MNRITQGTKLFAVAGCAFATLGVFAQGTAFTYQGRLDTGGSPANGNYDFTFTLWSTNSGGNEIGGAVTNAGVGVVNGLFMVTLDFGPGTFTGQSCWLQTAVETNRVGPYVALSPRQQLTPTPYSVYAESAGGVTNASITAPQLNTTGAPTNGQVLIYNGSGLEWANPASGGSGWALTGNAGTSPGTDFLGTTDNQPLQLRVNGVAGLGLYPEPNNSPNLTVGPFASFGIGAYGDYVFGGIGGAYNLVYPNYSTIAGGYGNNINPGAPQSVIGGGNGNSISGPGANGVIGGGYNNTVTGNFGAVPGGHGNLVSGNSGFAGGNTAQATNDGAFVWADDSGGPFASTSNNQFSVRALGGVRFVTGGAGLTVDGATVGAGGGGSSGWSLTGNAGTTPGTEFLGTTDDEPLELWVNGLQTFRLEPGNGNPNVVGGYGSSADSSVGGGTIAGGINNTISNSYPTVSGGYANHATGPGSVVGGGYNNTASGMEAVVSGGAQNLASGAGAFIGGGGYDGTTFSKNTATTPAATVGGGLQNAASGSYATVGGGSLNTANGQNAAIPGGYFNTASGAYSLAAGYGAEAQNTGAFVWADNSGGFFASTANNQFSVRAYGGVKIVTGGAGMTIDGVPVSTGGGGGGGSGWSLSGNAGTDPSVNFLGTTDDVGLELHVYSVRGIGLYPAQQGPAGPNNATDASVNVLGGCWENYISSGVVGATIAGGGEQHYDDLDGAENLPNGVNGNFGTVGGGYSNTAGYGGTVPGGINNVAAGNGSFAAGQQAQALHTGAFAWADSQNAPFASTGNDQFCVRAQGGVKLDNSTSVAFGSATRQMLELYRDPTSTYIYGIGVQSSTLYERAGVGAGFAWYSGGVHNNGQDNNGGGSTLMTLDSSGDLNVTANASICTLTIRGGCDVAEPFVMSASAIVKGSVVVIDEEHAGQLKLSDRPYDTRVAGIVSGANGINPGIALHQDGALQDGQNVALSGRVYVLADASGSPITPGDLLTTSAIPGYAMKVADHLKAQGAILGKAMTGLKNGQGMVLVLVTLQ